MTFVEAVYGSPFEETTRRGGDNTKARLNGNLFLSAFVFLAALAIGMLILLLVPDAERTYARITHSVFGSPGGRPVGKILALPVFGLTYLILSRTIGIRERFSRNT